MASIIVDGVRFNDATVPTDTILVDVIGYALGETPYVEVHRFAGGRQVSISQPGRERTLDLSLVHLSRSDVDWLRSHLEGDALVVRDPYGLRMWCVITAMSIAEQGGSSTSALAYQVTISLREIDGTDEV